MIVRHGQQLGLTIGEPFFGRGALALGAVSVAAGVVGDEGVVALLAAHDMAAEGRRAAALDRRHHLQLAEAHMTGVGSAPRRPVSAEDIRDLERRTRHGGRVLCRRPHPRDEMLERARDVAERFEGDAGVERRRIELLVPEQHLDHANVGLLLQKMSGEAVPQRVQRDPLVDLGHLRRGVAGAVELPGRERLDRVAPRKQPALRPRRLPPGAQQLEQMLGQHDVAVLAALAPGSSPGQALLDADDHPRAVDVGNLERDDVGRPEPRAVGNAQRCLVLEGRAPHRGDAPPRPGSTRPAAVAVPV
jgi:hypothetical protein